MLSIIIPTLDEASTIGKTLSYLQNLDGDFEVIIVDAGSHDATRKIAEKMGVQVIKSVRSIPQQLDDGLKEAQGDRFLFLHADCLPPKNVVELLSEVEGRVAGGFFHQYDKFHVLSALQASINNANARFFRRFCGEQSLFCTKDALRAAGGIPDSFVFENENFFENAKNNGVDVQLFPGRVVSSNRRFTNNGLAAFIGLNWAHAISPVASPYKLKKYFGRVR